MWENKNVSIVLDHWTNGKGDDWLKNFVQHALPDKGDVGYGGCGVIGGSCDFNLDCASMVEQAMGAEYWILKAVEGMNVQDRNALHILTRIQASTTSCKSPMNSSKIRPSTTSCRS